MKIISFLYSGIQELLHPNQIKAVLGMYKISEWQQSTSAIEKNDIDHSGGAYVVDIANIIPHPDYDCKKPDNDIGKYLCLSHFHIKIEFFIQSFFFHNFKIIFLKKKNKY
jgi:hypothetical protein